MAVSCPIAQDPRVETGELCISFSSSCPSFLAYRCLVPNLFILPTRQEIDAARFFHSGAPPGITTSSTSSNTSTNYFAISGRV
ncbi:hypothetical protein VTJ04DRAFT_5208 [Mycothermus thermophilus]|uniref:uncharacterized protein n=1 Tax=Humicola insolens TaxID=85995 RepID=UPI0037440892